MESVWIKDIEVKQNKVDIYFKPSKGIADYFQPEYHFFAEYDFDISNIPKSVLSVPILLNLLQFSWLTNSVIWIDEIDSDFYNCIPRLKNAFRELHPNIALKGSLIPAKIVKNRKQNRAKALQLFTGGVDATTTLIRIVDKKPILFNTNGWYVNDPKEENKVYNADVEFIDRIADQYELEAHYVKSNFARFIINKKMDDNICIPADTTWWFGFQHSMAFIGCAMIAAYKYGIEKVYIASSYTFGQYIRCVSDPRTDNCIQCAGIETVHDAYELSRQDKIKAIVEYQEKTKKKVALRVCSFNTKNCCKCEKCFRTMLALIAEGVDNLADYGFFFERTIVENLEFFIDNKANELDSDHVVFWNDIIDKMGRNYDNLKHKEIYDYLSNINLVEARRRAVWNHYKRDYKKIIYKKLLGK